tara:strand:+ start:36 stop:257 length:222 start_codon:yes stop_codon:yes gene_type:complete
MLRLPATEAVSATAAVLRAQQRAILVNILGLMLCSSLAEIVGLKYGEYKYTCLNKKQQRRSGERGGATEENYP